MRNDWQWLALMLALLLVLAAVIYFGNRYITPLWGDWLERFAK